ncbi:hypothetical protein CP8484711_0198A, partial [Chlamydia psittaci 84-8471/1]
MLTLQRIASHTSKNVSL